MVAKMYEVFLIDRPALSKRSAPLQNRREKIDKEGGEDNNTFLLILIFELFYTSRNSGQFSLTFLIQLFKAVKFFIQLFLSSERNHAPKLAIIYHSNHHRMLTPTMKKIVKRGEIGR